MIEPTNGAEVLTRVFLCTARTQLAVLYYKPPKVSDSAGLNPTQSFLAKDNCAVLVDDEIAVKPFYCTLGGLCKYLGL